MENLFILMSSDGQGGDGFAQIKAAQGEASQRIREADLGAQSTAREEGNALLNVIS